MKRFVYILIGSLIGASLLVGLTYLILSQKTFTTIKMGYAPFASNLPFFVAVERGYFLEQGLYIKPEKFVESKSMMDAFLMKRVDAIAPVALPVIFGVEQNQPGTLKLVLLAAETIERGGIVSGIIVKKDSSIDSIADLKGKRIGTYTGTASLVSLKLILEANKIDPEREVSIIQVAPELQIPSLLAGQFEALFTIEPYTSIAVVEGVGKFIDTNPRAKYITGPDRYPYIVGAQVCLKNSINKNKNLCEKITNALEKAIIFIKNNPAEAREILAKWSIYKKEVSMEVGLYEWLNISSDTKEYVKKMAEIFYKYGILKQPLDTQKMWLK
jgi:NitT/TauT family transport system substrate-binding protein